MSADSLGQENRSKDGAKLEDETIKTGDEEVVKDTNEELINSQQSETTLPSNEDETLESGSLGLSLASEGTTSISAKESRKSLRSKESKAASSKVEVDVQGHEAVGKSEAEQAQDVEDNQSEIKEKVTKLLTLADADIEEELDEKGDDQKYTGGEIIIDGPELQQVINALQLTPNPRESYCYSEITREVSPDEISFALDSTYDEEYVLEGGDEISVLEPEYDDKNVVEDKEPKIDREMYYKLYNVAREKYIETKLINNFLQKRLVEYYTRKHVWHVLKETPFQAGDVKGKYEQKLDHYEETLNKDSQERSNMARQIRDLREKKKMTSEELSSLFQQLQNYEANLAKELSDPDKQKNMEKIVERHLHRQTRQYENLIGLRMKYIILRNRLQESVEALKKLDHLGPGFTIMDYEQLKIDNRNLKDRLEEKEYELNKYRNQCKHSIQILAHRREKTTHLTIDIENLKEQLTHVDADLEEARENLMYVKNEKQDIRKRTHELRQEAGLLLKPQLLRDMVKSLDDIKSISEKLEGYKEDHEVKSKQVRCIRKRIEGAREWKKLSDKIKLLGISDSDSWYDLNGDKETKQIKEIKSTIAVSKKRYS